MKEKWRWVKGYRGIYRVSNLGRVKSVDRISYSAKRGPQKLKGRIIRTATFSGTHNYPVANLTKNGKQKVRGVHVMVLEAFVGPKPKGTVARHYPDRDPTNCRLDNLSWATYKRNQKDREEHGTMIRGLDHPNCVLSPKQVRQIRKLKGTMTQAKIGAIFGVDQSHICRIFNRQKRRKG